MSSVPSLPPPLGEFSPIGAHDVPKLAEAAGRSSTCLWAAFAPFMLAYGQSPARSVLVGNPGDATVVLASRTIRKRPHVDLLIPPLGPNPAQALDEIVGPLRDFNGDLETRILWADLPTAAWACGRQGWSVAPYEREYVYSRSSVLAMSGGAYRTLRKRIARCERELQPFVREYVADDKDACIDLLKRWQDAREDLVAPVFDFGYTRAALELADSIKEPWLTGIVVEIDRRPAAFAFGGAMSARGGPALGQFFLLKSDLDVPGLAETARVELIRRLEGCDLINDAGDLGRAGLAQHKRLFGPVGFVPTFKLALAPSA